ncbi:hypothetical protein [Chromobacterium vaccinii]|uniref:hypothetical protein n=1 Tax=Chromobacterium piscinae TaxID=686831 RepID=UPI00140C3845|nr:hypothetical protein [Chromobacterium vaccinii]
MKIPHHNLDEHHLDHTIKLLFKRSLLLSISFIAIMMGIYFSLTKNDWSWLNRFGSLTIVSGFFLTMSPIFSNGIYKSQSGAGRFSSLNSDKSLETTTSQERKNGDDIAMGILITTIGTIINGFGDVIAKSLFKF